MKKHIFKLILIALSMQAWGQHRPAQTVEGDQRFAVNGSIGYRVQHAIGQKKPAVASRPLDPSTSDWQHNTRHRYQWELRVLGRSNEFVSSHFRFTNPEGFRRGSTLEKTGLENTGAVAIAEAYMRVSSNDWIFHAGIIPISGGVGLDVDYSLNNKRSSHPSDATLPSAGPALMNWSIFTDESHVGFDLSRSIGESAEVQLQLTPISNMGPVVIGESPKNKHDGYRAHLRGKVDVNQLSFEPTASITTGVDSDTCGISFASGIDISYRVNRSFSIKGSVAGGGYYNHSLENPRVFLTGVSTFWRQENGNRLIFNYSYGTEKDLAVVGASRLFLHYTDLMYSFEPLPRFVVTPRLRGWFESYNNNSNHRTLIAPEIMLRANF